MITTLSLINTPIISYTFFMVITFKIYPLSNFQAYKTSLLTLQYVVP